MTGHIVEMQHYYPEHDEMVLVNWTLGNQCNYHCTYCDPVFNQGELQWMDPGVTTSFCDKIIDHYRNGGGKNIVFQFTGGEVTLDKELPRILEHVRARGIPAGIISNGSRKLDYWETLLPHLDHVMLSYHPEYGYADHFYDVVKLVNRKLPAYLNIMMHPEHFAACRELGLRLIAETKGNAVFFQALMNNLHDNHDIIGYRPEQAEELDRLYRYANDIVNRHARIMSRHLMKNIHADGSSEIACTGQYLLHKDYHWKNWVCWAGVDQIVISAQGDVFRAWCTQDWLGNVHQGPVSFPRYPVFCTRAICHCDSDIRLRRQQFRPL